MLFCKNCGIQLDDDAVFCHACGTTTPKTKPSSKAHPPVEPVESRGIGTKSRSLGVETEPVESRDLGAKPRSLGVEGHPELVEGQTIQRDGPVYGIVNLENLPAGHIIDERYEVKEKLGQGGFGAVYRAYDKKMKVDKALKIIPEAISNDRRAMQNLRQEAQTMIRLNHNKIIRVYDFQESGAVKYIDMEFIDGKSLNELLLDYPKQRMPEDKVKKLALKITEGLGYAHDQNVIHRDIKPQNIMLTKDGKIKIMDFGIAETLRTSMSMIQNTSTTGTLMYMSPEQLMGGAVRKTSDIYSLGATLYELLSGNPPFYRGDINDQIKNKIPDKIKHISAEMNAILLCCLKKDAAERIRDCEALKQAVKSGRISDADRRPETGDREEARQKAQVTRQKNKAGSRAPKAESKKEKWIGIAAAFLIIAILGIGFQQGWFSGSGQDNVVVSLETMKDASWDKLSDMNKKRVEALLIDADNLFIRDKLVKPENENAYVLYQKVLKIHPGNKYALAQLGLIRDDFAKRALPQVERENYSQAENIITAGFSYFPDDIALSGLKDANNVNRLFSEAKAQLKQKQPGQSLRRISEIERINSDHKPSQELKNDIGKYYLSRGDALFAQKKYSGSIEQYEKARALLPDKTQIAGKIKKAEIAAIEKAGREKQAAEERAREAEAERQRQLAEQRRREEAARQKLIDSFNLVYVKGGTFQMGSNSGDSDEKPVHRVTVSDFYIGKYEVTQKQWKAIMGGNPSNWKGDNLPVEKVSWNDVQKFLRKLNAKTSGNFRLPTEAEWEYAARGGSKSRGYKYAGSNNAGGVAWYDGNSGRKTHPVGQKKANELGLYDMSGNVWEWCSDRYGDYSSSAQTNPKGPNGGSYRVYRGGGWGYDAGLLRVSNRDRGTPGRRVSSLGFRLARTR